MKDYLITKNHLIIKDYLIMKNQIGFITSSRL